MQQVEQRVLWLSDVALRYRRDKSTIWRWLERGDLPPPDVVIGGRKGWFLASIEAHERTGAQRATA